MLLLGDPILDRTGQPKLWLQPDGTIQDALGRLRGRCDEAAGEVHVRGRHVASMRGSFLLDLQGKLLGRLRPVVDPTVQPPRAIDDRGASLTSEPLRAVHDPSLTPGAPAPTAVHFTPKPPSFAPDLPGAVGPAWSDRSLEEVFGF